MKKVLFSLLLLSFIISSVSFAGLSGKVIREVVRFTYIPIVEKTVIHYETKTIWVRKLDIAGITIEIKGDTIVLSSETFTLEIKKTGKIRPIEIIE